MYTFVVAGPSNIAHQGIACGVCDLFSPIGTNACSECGNGLAFFGEKVDSAPSGERGKVQEAMEQVRFYVCKECSSPVATGHKFCGACGATVPPDVLERRVEFFGALETHCKAKLLLIRGTDGIDGVSYILQGQDHIVGRGASSHIPFPNDGWISERHANFTYRDDSLVVVDEDSHNGIYVRVQGPTKLAAGTMFLCGEQVFRIEPPEIDSAGASPDQTYFYTSPKRPTPFRVVQMLRGGGEGMHYAARENAVHIGREDSDMNFPDDIFMSGKHAKIEIKSDGSFWLSDAASRNGTFVRIDGERALVHGDYLFIGQQLLRVEQTA